MIRSNIILLAIVILATFRLVRSSNSSYPYESSFTPDHIRYLQNETRQLFDHAWSSYMKYGFPADEVRPLSCQPYGPDFGNVDNTVRNDVMGNVSLSLLDNLDSLIIMEKWDELEFALAYLKQEQHTIFEKDTIIQVFEYSIRFLGGLMSSHLLLTDLIKDIEIYPKYQSLLHISKSYDGFLLSMAYDLGLRLIPAFKTSTNIPVPRINLAHGLSKVPAKLQRETCLSGAATPVLEFTLLSKLTGDPQFEYYTQLTYWKLWSLRLQLNLLPMTIDPVLSTWKDSITGVGASVDSFYEYAVKASILFNDEHLWSVFKSSYQALLTHLAQGGGPLDGSMVFANVDTDLGAVSTTWIDSLGAFWPGLLVLSGQLTDAIKTHLVYLKIWDHFDLIPERWNHLAMSKNAMNNSAKVIQAIPLEWYPLRPEFIESTYYLYRATRDPMYLQIGARVLKLFKTKYKSKCGLNGVQDVRLGAMQDRMETFVMSETLKYLYLLFDTQNEVFLHDNKIIGDKNWIFSTEGHPLWFHDKLDPTNANFLHHNRNILITKQNNKEHTLHSENKEEFDIASQQLFLYTLFSKIRQTSHHKLVGDDNQDHSYYRNISSTEVELIEIDGLDKIDYLDMGPGFGKRFDTCEREPRYSTQIPKTSKQFMVSGYYTWERLFDANCKYSETLVRPDYLLPSDDSLIELTSSFFNKYTMFAPIENELYLQCARELTTHKHDLFVGDKEGISSLQVSKMSYNANITNTDDREALMLEDDLWVPVLNSLRMKLETLQPGLIDLQNQDITQEYIESLRPDDYDSTHGVCNKQDIKNPATKTLNQALRIKKINGIDVNPGSVVWTKPFEIINDPSNNEPPVLDIASDSRVYLQGVAVENLMVWYG